ncbi:MAG: Tex family protein [Pirellulales bacterium]
MSIPATIDLGHVAHAVGLEVVQIEAALALLDAGNTVPFITRYRKDQTGGLDEVQIRAVWEHASTLRMLLDRKQTILRSIEMQGKLTPELAAEIEAAHSAKRLDDLYLPYKPKKQTLAIAARERGLEPLARDIVAGTVSGAELDARAAEFINPDKQVPAAAEALLGAGHILAEEFSENAELRSRLRKVMRKTGKLVSRKGDLDEKQAKPYADYFEFQEELRKVPPHRVLAINRGERAKALRVKVEADLPQMQQTADELLVPAEHANAEFLKGCVRDALDRLVIPSLEREVRRELTESAEKHAVTVFARNLRNLLLQSPVAGRRVLAIDPGFRSGCKMAAIDEFGQLLGHGILHVIGKSENRERANKRLADLLCQHQINVVAIGNGTACRETEQLVAELIAAAAARRRGEPNVPTAGQAESPAVAPPVDPTGDEPVSRAALRDAPSEAVTEESIGESTEAQGELQPSVAVAVEEPPEPAAAASPSAPAPQPISKDYLDRVPEDLAYVIVNEAGASVYSTSPIGREEFPQLDAAQRSAVSIGRRLLDPLSELVKIEPANIGVGMYQHDVKTKQLRESLDAVVESCVNYVGVDLNTASPALLRYVSGLNQLTARRVFEHRLQHGPFRSREELKAVMGFGDATFIQAAGFLRITGGDLPLDATWIHPESYDTARAVLAKLGAGESDLSAKEAAVSLAARASAADAMAMARELGVGVHLLRDILSQLARPGRDPREELPKPIFRQGILKIDDLSPGMELSGTVLNVVDFGAFVDIGLHDSGLVHVSQMANRFVRDPHELLAVGDIVKVWVTSIDKDRRRVGLTMISPGQKRREQERRKPRGKGGREQRPAEPATAEATGGGVTPAVAETTQRPTPSHAQREQGRSHQQGRRPERPRYEKRQDKPQQFRPKPKPKPLTPITKAMEEGKEPLRTFGDLMQFFEKKIHEDTPGESS